MKSMRNAVIALALAFVVAAHSASAAQRVVDTVDNADTVDYYGNDPATVYTTINAALAAAAAGDTVFVNPGTYGDAIAHSAWPGANTWIIGSDVDSVTVERATNSSFYVDVPQTAGYSGCGIRDITFNHTSTQGWLFDAALCKGFTVSNVKATGGFNLLVYVSTVGVADGFVIENSEFTPTGLATLAYVWTQAYADNWTIEGNTFDFSNISDYTRSSLLLFQAATGLLFSGNEITTCPTGTAGVLRAVQVQGRSGVSSDACTFTKNIVRSNGHNQAWVGFYIGDANNTVEDTCDSMVVSYNTMIMEPSPATSQYGIEFETLYTGAARSDYNAIIGNVCLNGTLGISTAECFANSVVAGNYLAGQATRAITTQGVRRVVYSNNFIENTPLAINMDDQSSPASFSYKNFGNVFAGNFMRNVGTVIKVEGTDTDSMTYYGGNIAVNATEWADHPSDTSMTLADWQAYSPPFDPADATTPVALRAGIGSLIVADDAPLLASRALPQGFYKTLGSRRSGVER